MAIKNSDPRKFQDVDITGRPFERVVIDAWETRHESEVDLAATPAGQTADTPDQSVSNYHEGSPTYHPFENLKDELRRH